MLTEFFGLVLVQSLVLLSEQLQVPFGRIDIKAYEECLDYDDLESVVENVNTDLVMKEFLDGIKRA